MSVDACPLSKREDATLPRRISTEELIKILAGTTDDHSGILPGLQMEIEAERNRFRKRITMILGKQAGYSEDPSSVQSFNRCLEMDSLTERAG